MKIENKTTCFVTVANIEYQQYIPWWIYFLNNAYPEARKIILTCSPLDQAVDHAIRVLDGNFVIKQCAFKKYRSASGDVIKILRWLHFDEEYLNYDYLSIGDVDMAICQEKPSYFEQHASHMDIINLPYSNFVRNVPPVDRMSGTHVVKTKKYFDKILPIIQKYREKLDHQKLASINSQGYNEKLLHKIVVDAFGNPPENLWNTYWSSLNSSNHHGIHIRLAELGGFDGLKSARGFEKHKQSVIEATKTVVFTKLFNLFPDTGRILLNTANEYSQIQ